MPSGLGSFDEEYQNAISVELDGLIMKVLPLERIIVSKEAAGRNKDKIALPILKAALRIRDSEKD